MADGVGAQAVVLAHLLLQRTAGLQLGALVTQSCTLGAFLVAVQP